jgi:hypothetical protein
MAAPSFGRGPLLFVLIVSAAGCGMEHPSESSRLPPAALLVENRSANDVVVYLADGHTPLRLGRVTALDRARLAMPAHAATAGARLFMRSVGRADVFVDGPVVPGAGGTLELTVQPLLAQSTLAVRSFGR